MKILSFDVGIKNLAYIIFDCDNNNITIDKWDIICLVDKNIKCSEINLIDLGKNMFSFFSR